MFSKSLSLEADPGAFSYIVQPCNIQWLGLVFVWILLLSLFFLILSDTGYATKQPVNAHLAVVASLLSAVLLSRVALFELHKTSRFLFNIEGFTL